ncbi:MAG: phosphoribosylformylglycinamidine synthase [Myxococcales bacterium]|jgi:phosphoribosylformylglycinamidine synthase|nr:phosphoribosylformylglycinamidine synthase [Myxococcales bacterium]
MTHRIEIQLKQEFTDADGQRVASDIRERLGCPIEKIRCIDVYSTDAELPRDDLEALAREFADPVAQRWSVDAPLASDFDWIVEVGFRPGVTDNAGRTATECARLVLGDRFPADGAWFAARQYLIAANLERAQVDRLTDELLCNDLIQRHRIVSAADFDAALGLPTEVPRVTDNAEPQVRTIDLEVSDDDLLQLSRDMMLALSLPEMQAIRAFYRRIDVQEIRAAKGLTPQPTDVEVEVFAQTWSEHCKHKIFNARIAYKENSDQPEPEIIDSIYKSYVKETTHQVRTRLGSEDYCLSVFQDNAGVWKFTDDWNLVFKAETHNSPSALDPYGGAMTGVVGVNRDALGTGQGAHLFCNTNVFCLADPFYDQELPPRLLHPRRVLEGVRAGVEHGGGKSGAPTVNGSLVFDERFLGKPLVFCGAGGLMPAVINDKPGHEKKANAGDRVLMVGGRIGKDGIHGATFSSEELHEGSPATTVQIGDPITQKRMVDFLLKARDEGLMSCLTDNGAGGLASSVGEMAEDSGGACIDLALAPLKYPGLHPWEIFVSEAQERMTAAVPPEHLPRFLSLAKEMAVEATDLGEYTEGPYLELHYEGRPVALFDMDFLHNGVPQMELEANWTPSDESPVDARTDAPPDEVLLRMLGRLDICSKEYWVRQYDHEVLGGSVVKPLCGAHDDGPSDAAVMRPLLDSMRGVAVSHGICPTYSDIDTYHMTACAVDEAMRNLVCVGADPTRVAALDNFCWCDPVKSPTNPDGDYKLAQLVRSAKALKDVCITYRMPLVSGKDSMKNDYAIGDTRISIPPTLLVSAVGQLDDVRVAVTMDAKQAGDLVYIVGTTHCDMGATQYFSMLGRKGGQVPRLRDPEGTYESYVWLHRAIKSRLVASCHDLSDGGLAVAVAETAFAGDLGLSVNLADVPAEGISCCEELLYAETPGRLLVTVSPASAAAFETLMKPYATRVGLVTEARQVVMRGLDGEVLIDADIAELKRAWRTPLLFQEVN